MSSSLGEMAVRTLLCLIAVAGEIGCCSTEDDSVRVSVLNETNNMRVCVLDFDGSHAPGDLSACLSRFLPPDSVAPEVEVLAWSCKAEFEERVPHLVDEVLVLVNDRQDSPRWTLLSLCRFRGIGSLEKWRLNMRWLENNCQGAVVWKEQDTEKPDVQTLLTFLKKTNFGANELFDDKRPLVVYLFAYKSQEVIDTLRTGIDSDERSHRRDLFMEMNASPAD